MTRLGIPELPRLGMGLPQLPRLGRDPYDEMSDEQERSLIRRIGGTALGGISAIGNLLDLPGSVARDILAGENPLDQFGSIFSPENRTTGRDLLRRYGLAGRRDTWGNFAAGLGAEIALDPLTYMSFGGSALTKGGRALKAAGVLDDATRAAQRASGIGPRQFRLTTNVGDVLADAPEGALQRFQQAAEGMGTTVEALRGERIGGSFGLNLPFGESRAVANLPGGEQIARGLDVAGHAIRFGKYSPVRHLAGQFGSGMGGATTESVQKGLPELHEAVRAENVALHDELFEILDAPAVQSHMDFNEAMRKTGDVLEANKELNNRGNQMLRYLEGIDRNWQGPEELLPSLDRGRQLVQDVANLLEESGVNSSRLSDLWADYWTRSRVRFPGGGPSGAGRRIKLKSGFEDPRLDFLTNMPRGTEVIQRMSVDPEISGFAHTREVIKQEGVEALDAAVDKMEGKFPGGAPKLTKEELDDRVAYVMENYGDDLQFEVRPGEQLGLSDENVRKMTEWVANLDPRHAELQQPAFQRNPLASLEARLDAAAKTAGYSKGISKILGQQLGVADDFPIGQGITSLEMLDRAHGGKATDRAKQMLIEHAGEAGNKALQAARLQAGKTAGETLQTAQAKAFAGRDELVEGLEKPFGDLERKLNAAIDDAKIKQSNLFTHTAPEAVEEFMDEITEMDPENFAPGVLERVKGIAREVGISGKMKKEFQDLIEPIEKGWQTQHSGLEGIADPMESPVREVIREFQRSTLPGKLASAARSQLRGSNLDRVRDSLADATEAIFERGEGVFAKSAAKAAKKFGTEAVEAPAGREAWTEALQRLTDADTLEDVDFDEIAEIYNRGLNELRGSAEGAIGQAADDSLKALGKVSDDEILKHLHVPKDVAADVERIMQAQMNPKELNPLMEMVDKFLQHWRSSVTAWPAFHSRNHVSGMVQSAMANALDPKSYTQGLRLVRSQDPIKGLAESVPAFKGMSDAEATRELRKLLFSHDVLDARHGSHVLDNVAQPTSRLPGTGGPLLKRIFGNVPEGVGLGARVNPLATETFAPFRISRNLGNVVEAWNRTSPFLSLLKKGWDPAEAAKRVNAIQVDYKAAAAADPAMRRLFPFWSFTKGAVPFMVSELTERPGGRMGRTIMGINRSRDPSEVTPDYVAETASVPLGEVGDGSQRYLTGLGLMFEDPLSFISADKPIQSALFEAASRMAPGPKTLAELAMGQSLFQRGSGGIGGRPLADLDPATGRIAANISDLATGEQTRRADPLFGQTAETLISNSPLSRALTTLRTITDPRKLDAPFGLFANIATGVRISDVSPAAQDAILRERLQDAMRGIGGRSFERVFIPQDTLLNMSPEERAVANRFNALMGRINQRQKVRREGG